MAFSSMMARARLVSTVAVAALGFSIAAAPAQAQGRKIEHFNIVAQDLTGSLENYALQANTQIIYSDAIGSGARSSALIGDFTTQEALARLLSGTGFTYRRLPGGVIRVIRDTMKPRETSLLVPVAAAQTVSASAVAAPPASAAPASTTPGDRDIIVTGSRVIQNGNASPTPLTVVNTDTMMNIRPSTIADDLNSIPAFSGSRGQTSFGQGTGGAGGGNAVASVLNLRNLGWNRNLVLMDGRRVPPTTGFNTVDIDTIPQLLLQHVDIVTGGVSAVYGSDAISGVVNFVLDHHFNGIKAQAYTGISQYNDDPTYDAAIALGTKFAGGRGHFEMSYEYRDDKGLLSRFSRPWYNSPASVGSGTAASPITLITNARLPNSPFGGRINCGTTCSLNGQYFASNGALSPFVNGQSVLINGNAVASPQIGGAGGYQDNSVKSPLESHQLFARADYDISDDISVFAYGSANIKRNAAYIDWMNLNNVTLSSTNPFLSPAYQNILSAAGQTFTLNGLVNQEDTRVGYISKSYQYIAVAGITGKTGGVKWDATFNHGDALLHTTITNDVNQQHLAASLNAARDGSGNIVCGINADAIASNNDAACAPFNPFGPTAASQQALNYILQDTHYRLHTLQNDIVFNAAGSPISTWAGPVQLALTAEWRQMSVKASSDYTPSNYANCTGIAYNCSASTLLYIQTFSNWPEVRQSVAEGGVEAEVPLLRDKKFFKELSLNGAARYTDYYDTAGSYWTWKVGASWAVDDDLRFRGTISRDIRAPTLNDLYAPLQTNVSNSQPDLLTGTNPVIPQNQYGNPNLKAEIGNTKTIGLVWKPKAARGLSVALDYYNIKVTNAIVTIIGSTASYQNACYASGGSSLYCAFQTRPAGGNFTSTAASNAWTSFLAYPLNIGKITTQGVDFELNYNTQLFDRAFNMRLLTAWQPHIRYYQQGLPVLDQAGVNSGTAGITDAPKWRLTAMLSYQVIPSVRVDLQERWRSHLLVSSDPTAVFASNQVIPSFAQTALNISYTLPFIHGRNKSELFLNIQNLFNAYPPSAQLGNAAPGHNGGWVIDDDVIGRYFTMGLRVRI